MKTSTWVLIGSAALCASLFWSGSVVPGQAPKATREIEVKVADTLTGEPEPFIEDATRTAKVQEKASTPSKPAQRRSFLRLRPLGLMLGLAMRSMQVGGAILTGAAATRPPGVVPYNVNGNQPGTEVSWSVLGLADNEDEGGEGSDAVVWTGGS